MPTIGDVLIQGRAALKHALTLTEREAGLETHILLGRALCKPRAYLLAHREDPVAPAELTDFSGLLERRLRGEPIAYILGEWEFFGLMLEVTPDVLVPRPETELLVELALERIPPNRSARILDLGTGSGAIAISIARERPLAQLTAVDLSPAALAVATRNAARHGCANLRLLQSDWFQGLLADASFDVIVSNPPYIPSDDSHLAQDGVRFEPRCALTAGTLGLDAIVAILRSFKGRLAESGHLLIEHGYEQGAACRDLFEAAGLEQVSTWRDLAGVDRVTTGKQPSKP